MIESIHIKNFRGIQDGKIDRFSKINLLVGPNNSGKSAVLETIYLANTASQEVGISLPGIDYEVTTSEKDLLGDEPFGRVCERHKKKVENLRDQGSIGKISYNIHLGKSAVKAGLFSLQIGAGWINDRKTDSEFYKALMAFLFGEAYKDIVPYDSRLIYCWATALTYYQKGDSAWIIKGQLPSAKNTFFYDVQNTLSHFPFEFFRKMIVTIPGWTQKIGRRFGQVFDLSKNFNVNFFQPQDALHLTQGYISPEDKIALTIDDYGDGSRSAFKLLTPLIALSELATEAEPGVFIWEEPELFQNPQSLGKLLAEVTELIKDKPIQLFIATHSIEVVGQFVGLVNEQAIGAEDLLAIRLNLQDGQLSSSAFNHQDIQDWTAMHLDLRVPDGRVDSPLKFQLAEARNDDE